LEYDESFAIRGLNFDILKGNLLKLDYLNNIQVGSTFHGRQRLTKEEIMKQYNGLHVSHTYVSENMNSLLDQFALSESCLLADITELFRTTSEPFNPAYLYEDVKKAVSWIHYTGELHSKICSDISNFLEPNEELAEFLMLLKSRGKKVKCRLFFFFFAYLNIFLVVSFDE